MKKIYFLFSIFFFSICGAQIVNIPDANFKAYLLSANSTNSIASNISNQHIVIDANGDNEIQVSEALNVYKLYISGPSASMINNLTGINYFNNLIDLQAYNISLTDLQISGLPNLTAILVINNQISSLSINNLSSLQAISFANNQISNFSITNCPNLQQLDCSGNQLTAIDVSNFADLVTLQCYNNLIASINLYNNNNLLNIIGYNNLLSNINLVEAPNLINLRIFNNSFTQIDVSEQTQLNDFNCSNNPNLISINLKNGINNYNQGSIINFSNTPNLQYICVDDFEIATTSSLLNYYNQSNVVVNSYCSFTPGGTFYTIEGNTKYDINNNGCDVSDPKKAFQKFNISGASGSGSLISNSLGEYSIPVQAGSHTITPVLENPTYFNISPTSFTANFPSQTSPLDQNFCLSANGNHNDLEIVIIPLTAARPGFPAKYKILYKNKGTTAQIGSFTFNYDDNLMNYVNATIAPTSQSTGVLNYDFVNLLPFQVREITVTFTLSTPTATPPLVGGQILNYTAQINGLADETALDNTFTLNQTVVNSFDPNDKTCLEGTQIMQTKVGDYVHYLIRFENTGTANAQNIVVKDIIDTSKFDINSLVAMSGSHSFVTRITNPNTVEFIFEGIQLPFNNLYNDGYVCFKIKTKSSLVLGDSFSNTANIYFDYNAPIVTNIYTTTVANILGTSEISAGIEQMEFYPNPVENFINFKGKESVIKIEIYDASGRIVFSKGVKNNVTDVSGLKTGNYFLKIYTKDQYYINKMVKK